MTVKDPPVMDLTEGLYEILAELLHRTTEGAVNDTSRHRVQALVHIHRAEHPDQ